MKSYRILTVLLTALLLLGGCSSGSDIPNPAYVLSGDESPQIRSVDGQTLIDINLLFSYAMEESWTSAACAQSIWMLGGNGMLQEDLASSLDPDKNGKVDPDTLISVLSDLKTSYQKDVLDVQDPEAQAAFVSRVIADLQENKPVIFSFYRSEGSDDLIYSLLIGTVLDLDGSPILYKYTWPLYESDKDGSYKVLSATPEELSQLMGETQEYFY